MAETNETQALRLLEPMATADLVERARRAVKDGTHAWYRDPFGAFGLVRVGTRDRADVVVYPPDPTGVHPADFEVDDGWGF